MLLGRVRNGELVKHYETVRRCKDGQLIDVSVSISPVRDHNGTIIGAAKIARKLIEESLRDNQELLNAIVRLLPLGLWILDSKGQILFRNDAAKRIWGEVRGEVEPLGSYKGWRQEGEARIADHEWAGARAIAKGETSIEEEIQIECFDGTRKTILDSAVPLYRKDGSLRGAVTINHDITESKMVGLALRESEAAYRELAELVPQLVWKCTPDGLNIYFNQRWVEYTGLTLEESHGRGWNTPFHPEDKQPAWAAWNRAVRTGETYQINCRLRAAAGSYRWFLIKGVPFRDAAGNIVYWFGTCTDIDDLKQAEERITILNQDLESRVALRTAELSRVNALLAQDISERQKMEDSLHESEARFRSLVQHASDAFFLHDFEGRFIDVNEQAAVSLGYTREELLRMSVFDVEDDFDLKSAQEAWDRMKSTGPVTLEGHHRRKDGTRFPHEARLSTYEVEGRQLILRLVRDTSDRVRIEEKLRESEATIHALLDSAAQAILAADPRGVIVLANRMVGQMFGYATNELLGKEIEVLIPQSLQERHRGHRDGFNANPKPRAMGLGLDLQGLRKDGSEFPIEVSLSSVDTKQGLLAVSFVSDITARKRAETDLRESEQKLRMLAGSLLTAQEDERRNLARELHDDVTQQLALLSIELGRLATELPETPGDARERIQTLQKQLLDASTGVRRLSHGLHPAQRCRSWPGD